jgi:hypothetical protein
LGRSRAIDVSEGDVLDQPALKALVRAGVAHNLAKARPGKARPAKARPGRARTGARGTR